jgi:hypothetical protein
VTEVENPVNDQRDEDPPNVEARTTDENNRDNGGPPDVKDPTIDQDDIRSNSEDRIESSDEKDNGGPNEITRNVDGNSMNDIEAKDSEKRGG